ncbi:MAG: DEAD/DEAH box helicase family protein, partial [Bacteroidaceae bacterium]|nr:DEAD/DEAH box helicase family protein [Bacteroidaceae bacterium]
MKYGVHLRDYQEEMVVRLQHAWEKHRGVMVQMPTGVGKTVLLAETIREEFKINKFKIQNSSAAASGGVLIVAHRIELIEQISRTLDRFGIEHGLIVSGKPADETKPVQVASIQTLSRRIPETSKGNSDFLLFTFHFSLVIIDEAHHALAKTYKMLWDRWPQARFLGLTATPCRMNHAGFTDLFDTILVS